MNPIAISQLTQWPVACKQDVNKALLNSTTYVPELLSTMTIFIEGPCLHFEI